jgi:hypothetical protein
MQSYDLSPQPRFEWFFPPYSIPCKCQRRLHQNAIKILDFQNESFEIFKFMPDFFKIFIQEDLEFQPLGNISIKRFLDSKLLGLKPKPKGNHFIPLVSNLGIKIGANDTLCDY